MIAAAKRTMLAKSNQKLAKKCDWEVEIRGRDVLMLGNPEVGNPIAAEHIKAPPITSRFGCGSFIPAPTC